jgi:hypothetical protein
MHFQLALMGQIEAPPRGPETVEAKNLPGTGRFLRGEAIT